MTVTTMNKVSDRRLVDSPEHQRTEPDPSTQQTLNETAELAELMDEERADFDMQWAEFSTVAKARMSKRYLGSACVRQTRLCWR